MADQRRLWVTEVTHEAACGADRYSRLEDLADLLGVTASLLRRAKREGPRVQISAARLRELKADLASIALELGRSLPDTGRRGGGRG